MDSCDLERLLIEHTDAWNSPDITLFADGLRLRRHAVEHVPGTHLTAR